MQKIRLPWPRTSALGFAVVTLALSVAVRSVQAEKTNGVFTIDLPTTLRLANARNLDIQIARERLRQAQADRDVAFSQFLPWISAGAAYRRHDGRIQAVEGTLFDTSKQSYNVGGALAAQVDVGETLYRNLAAKQVLKAAGHALDAQRQDSTLAAAEAYLDLARAAAIADVVKESLRISREYESQVHEAVNAGIAFKGDELRVRGQSERYEIDLRQTAEQRETLAAQLAEILHLGAETALVPETAELVPAHIAETNVPLDSLVQQALRNRPHLKETQALVSAAREERAGVLYGPMIPSVNGQAFLGGLGGGKNSSTGNFSDSEDYGLGIGWRIGPGGLFDSARGRAGDAHFEIARLASQKLADAIIREVVQARARVDSLQDQLSYARQNLETSSETLRLAQERKEFAVGAVLEVIQAQQDLIRARTGYLNTVADYLKGQYTLLHAIGTPQLPAGKGD